jgi:hypothetical protein
MKHITTLEGIEKSRREQMQEVELERSRNKQRFISLPCSIQKGAHLFTSAPEIQPLRPEDVMKSTLETAHNSIF